jgi:hypothetical protein
VRGALWMLSGICATNPYYTDGMLASQATNVCSEPVMSR